MTYTEMLLRTYSRRMEDPAAVIGAFEAKLRAPERSQRDTLADILRRASNTEYGRRWNFDTIADYESYRARVPMVGYDMLAPAIERMRGGAPDVLIPGTASYFSTTSGSTAAPKFIPGTQQTIVAGCEAILVRNSYLRRDHPDALAGRSLCIAGRASEGRTAAGVTYGAMTGFGYHVGQMGVRGRSFPYDLFTIADHRVRSQCLLHAVLSAHDLTSIVVYNPSTLLLLLEAAVNEWDAIVDGIRDGRLPHGITPPGESRDALADLFVPRPERAAALRSLGASGPRAWWPGLSMVMCWTGGALGFYLDELRPWIAGIPIRDLGIIASEAMLTIPVSDARTGSGGGVVLPDGAFFEFVPVGAPDADAVPVWRLETGAAYRVVVTTRAGLYRYDLGDIVQVDGVHCGMPLLSFRYRAGRVYSFTGEKLTEHHVTSAIRTAADAAGVRLLGFTAVPTWDRPPFYEIRAEVAAAASEAVCERFAAAIDPALEANNVEYASKRASGRLGPAVLSLVEPGSFERRRHARARHDAQYKETHLAADPADGRDLPVMRRVSC